MTKQPIHIPARVGVLYSGNSHDRYEKTYGDKALANIAKYGTEVVEIDYHAYDFNRYKQHSTSLHRDLKRHVRNLIKTQKLDSIVLPGDWYNYDAPPMHKPPYKRPQFTRAIVEVCMEDGVRLMGICGGLQGTAASLGLPLARVKDIIPSSSDSQVHEHRISELPANASASTHRKECTNRVTNKSQLSRVLRKARHPWSWFLTSNGHITSSIPEIHSGALDTRPNSGLNKRMQALGIKPVAWHGDHIIEALEFKHHPWISLFQGHPELSDGPDGQAIMRNFLEQSLKDRARKKPLHSDNVISGAFKGIAVAAVIMLTLAILWASFGLAGGIFAFLGGMASSLSGSAALGIAATTATLTAGAAMLGIAGQTSYVAISNTHNQHQRQHHEANRPRFTPWYSNDAPDMPWTQAKSQQPSTSLQQEAGTKDLPSSTLSDVDASALPGKQSIARSEVRI